MSYALEVGAIGQCLQDGLPSEKERRRYALLQAAAILKASVVIIPGSPYTAQKWWEQAVNDAEKLLGEIEKREKPEPQPVAGGPF